MAGSLRIYKALADESRLRLMRLLSRAALNVNELQDILQMGQSRVSRHLKILADVQLISNRREGTWIYYQWEERATDTIIGDTLAFLQRHERSVPNSMRLTQRFSQIAGEYRHMGIRPYVASESTKK